MLGRTVLTIATVAAVVVILATPATAADEPDGKDAGPQVTSYLHTVRPSAIRPGDDLTLAGVVENTGDETLTNVQVLPRWSNVQLETREEVHQVGTDPSIRWGFRRGEPYQVVDEHLQPGERREFQLHFDDVAQLGLGLAGVYAIGVDVRGSLPGGQRVTLDTARTVLPWFPGDTPPEVPVALLWPVEAPPSLLPDGALRDEALGSRLAEGGTLDAVVDAAGSSPVTWLVDPDVLDTVDAMKDGYETGLDADDRTSGEAAAAASAWRAAFDDATTDGTVLLLPYARPDVEALLATQPSLAARLARESVTTTRVAARAVGGARTGVAWPNGGHASEETLSLFAGSGVRTVILSGDTVDAAPTDPLTRMSTSNGALDVVLTDPGLSSALADSYTAAEPEAGALDLRQRWSADTAMAALEAVARGEQPTPSVIAPPSRWTPDPQVASSVVDTWMSLPWVEPTSLAALGVQDQRGEAGVVETVPPEAVTAVPTENAVAAEKLSTAVQDYTDLLAAPDTERTEALQRATVRAASMSWRDDPAAGVEYATAMTDDLDEQLDDVRISVPESVTLSSRTGIFPLTVTNELDRPVTVKLAIRAANPDRLRVDDVDQQVVEADSRTTVEVRAEAATNGRVPITVQLVTNNDAPLGPPRRTVVNATDYGTIGWVIIAGAAGVFGVSVLRTMVRRRRGPPDEGETIDDPESATEPGQVQGGSVHAPEVTR